MKQAYGRRNTDVIKNACLTSCKKILARIQKVRDAIYTETREAFQAPERLVQLALSEAEALAWQTHYPQLVFPTLAEEKVQSVLAWSEQQDRVRRRSVLAML